LQTITSYLPNNKCNANVEHHDHENEVQHMHKHENEQNSQKNGCLCVQFNNSTNSNQESATMQLPSRQSSLTAVKKADSVRKSEPTEEPLVRNHSHSHGHSHAFGHIHNYLAQGKHNYKTPREKAHHDHHIKHERQINDVKLIAWMVLMGDGLHNFSDGLAIGASFASSITTGFGTSIAVLCHELPHEIGDYAVLRRAGVSFKRALLFNAISGVLCMIGVIVGLLIGGFELFKNWSFLFIAGTFLYISLVDMVS
jgi:zinc transporter ZupT